MQRGPDPVVYQVYPRSFQDSDGDGVGDLAGVVSRLDHIAALGADALWLSPVYPSPGADMGYDVSDFRDVDPLFGGLGALDRLIGEAHSRGLGVLMDLVPCHTSIEHPWFTERPDFYIWADGSDGRPPNNWVAAFGGAAWSPDPGGSGRWYLHSFYPEQPDLDWRNPDVVAAMGDVIAYWLDRGVDGFRLDAIDRLLKDRQLRDEPPAHEPFSLPLPDEARGLDTIRSRDATDIGDALAAVRAAAGDALLVGEVFLPPERQERYLEHLDAVFSFELFFAPWEAGALREAIGAAAALDRSAWVLSNHDFPRVATRAGEENARAAAVLLLTLPGPAFVYQGEEIGQVDGPAGERRHDRWGRDAHRRPVQWAADPRTGGFTSGDPWLEPVDAATRNVEAQVGDPDSMLGLYRRLIALRPALAPELEMLDAAPGVVAYRRGEHVVAVNTTGDEHPAPARGELVLESTSGAGADGLAPHAATVVRAAG
jgi:alpha-glucosidase